MMIITKYPERYSEEFKKVHEVVDHLVLYHDSDRIAVEQGQHSFRELENTAAGPCLVIGMGRSRTALAGRKLKVPSFAINRAILDFPDASWWAAHDLDGLLDVIDRVRPDTPVLTYSCNFRKESWAKVTASGRKVWFVEIFPDPRRHKRRPLYWNQSTVGWLWDLVQRMGYGPIYNVGIDATGGSYVNPHFPPDELVSQHDAVRDRIKDMFRPTEVGAWNSRGVTLYDLSDDPYLPVERRPISEVLA